MSLWPTKSIHLKVYYKYVGFNHVSVVLVVTNLLCEFLEVAFHCVLHVREIYPPILFERARKYNTTVQVVSMCMHACVT